MVKSSLIDQLFLITWSYSTNSAQPLIWIQKPQFALLLNVTVSYISCLNWTSSFSYNTFKGRKRKGNLCYWHQLCYSIFHLLPGHLSKTTRWLHPWSLLCLLCSRWLDHCVLSRTSHCLLRMVPVAKAAIPSMRSTRRANWSRRAWWWLSELTNQRNWICRRKPG